MFSRQSGYKSSWRSSRLLIVSTCLLGVSCHVFLLGFIVPILPYMLRNRLAIEEEDVQAYASGLLSIYALTSILASPMMGIAVEKIPSRKLPLLAGITGEIMATIIVALAPNVPILYIGRILQALSGTTASIVGMATLVDVVDQEYLGRVIGLKSSTVAIACTAGPMISGWLNELVGYYAAWSATIFILVIDLIMRLLAKPVKLSKLRVQFDSKPPPSDPGSCSDDSRSIASSVLKDDDEEESSSSDERQPLLQKTPSNPHAEEVKGIHFYLLLLRNRRFVASQCCYVMYAITYSSFDATLPLHVTEAFGWGSGLAGLMFLSMQIPQMVLSTLFGWLRDHYGTRIPTTTAFLLLAPALAMLGLPGAGSSVTFEVGTGNAGKAVYIVAVICCGVLFSLLNGVGQVESRWVIDDLEEKHPGIFGKNGGYARSYSVALMNWMFGLFVGPLLAGSLTSRSGYLTMCLTFGGMCLCTALGSFIFLKGR